MDCCIMIPFFKFRNKAALSQTTNFNSENKNSMFATVYCGL
ncbi:hypothetical protein BMETH_2564_0 [methanotrophic bacterial endosymbiont of Bathymodiolus sp.]|nr:hypothetical protein BMETH_2564_0 [methanotrophic bacterial endosymbiont of Bathymodiolus sp.]